MAEGKRKSETSSAVKRRYNQKTYGAVTAYVPKDLAAAFKDKCAVKGISQAQIQKGNRGFFERVNEGKGDGRPSPFFRFLGGGPDNGTEKGRGKKGG